MRAISLQSGSNGIYVEAAGTRLPFDAGLSGVQTQSLRVATRYKASEVLEV